MPSRQTNLRLPVALADRLADDAAAAGTTVQAVVLEILAAHYGLVVAAPRRGIRPPEPVPVTPAEPQRRRAKRSAVRRA